VPRFEDFIVQHAGNAEAAVGALQVDLSVARGPLIEPLNDGRVL